MKNSQSFNNFICLALMGTALVSCGKMPEAVDDLASGIGSTSGSTRIDATVASTGAVNQCLPVILNLLDGSGAPIVASEALNIQMSGISTGELFSEASCVTALGSSSLAWAKGQSSRLLYIKPSTSQTYTLQFVESSQKVIGQYKLVTIGTGGGAEDLRLSITGPASFLSGQCKAMTVSLQNTSGASRTRTSSTTINLSGGSSGTFYAGSNCSGGGVTSLTLGAGTSAIAFSFRDATAENLMLQADTAVSGISSGFLNVEVQSSAQYAPSQLAITGPTAVTAGACSAPVLVKTLDSFGNAATNAANQTFTLSGNLGFQAYSDAGCLTPLVAPQIAAGASAMNFYFSASSGGALTINADDGGALLDTSLAVTVSASVGGSATNIAVTGPSTLPVGTCSSAYLVKTKDGSGVDYAVTSTTTINLTGKGSGDFYSDGACTSVISSLTFAPGDSAKSFYYRTTAVGSLVFNADDAGALVPGSQSVNIVPGAPATLELTGPTPINLADCRAYVVTSKDSGGYASAVSSPTVIDLTGAGTGIYYQDAACATATSSVTIASGQSSAILYYKASGAGARTLSADDLGALTAGTLNVTVNALPATKIAFNRPVIKAGVCTTLTATLKDSINGNVTTGSNVTVNLSASSGTFYSDAGCSTSTTSILVGTGTSSSTLYYRHTVAEAVTLTAASAGLSSDAWDTTIGANTPDRLVLQGTTPQAAGACAALSVVSQDASGNLSPVTSSTLVTMSGAGSGKFSSQADCSGVSSTLTLPSGQSAGTIYYQNNVAESVTLQAAAAGLTAGTLGLTTQTGGATKLKWTLATTKSAGTCIVGSLQVQDALNNPVVQGSNRTVNLIDLGSSQFFTSADCSGGAVTSLTVTTGQSSVSFSVRDNTAENLTLSATSAGLSSASQALAVTAGAPNRLMITGLAAILAGDCTAYDVRSEDTLGNLSPVSANTTVSFSGLSLGKFYSDAACSAQVTSTILASGSSSKTVYFKNNSAESITASGTAAGLTAASKAITIQTQTAVAFGVTGPASAAAQVCSTFTVRTQDVFGNAVVQGSNLTVDLLGRGNGQFYSDAGCATPITQVTINGGSSSASFRFSSTVAEALTFTVQNSGSGLTDGTRAHIVQPLAPTTLSLTGVSTLSSGVCAGFTLSVQDSLGNASPVGSAKSLNLTGAGTGSFYSEASCSNAITTSSLGSSQTSLILYYKAPGAQSVTLNVDDVGLPNLTAATRAVTVTSSGGGGATLALRLNGASTLNTNTCSPYAVLTVDAGGNSQNVTSDLTVTLAGGGAGTFYSDSSCATASNTVTVMNGSSLAYIYFSDPTAQNLVFAATASGASTATFPVSVTAASGGSTSGPAVKLAFIAQPSSVATVNVDLQQQPIVGVQDSNGQTVSAASNNITLAAYSDSGCTTLAGGTLTVTTNPLAASGGMANFAGVRQSNAQTMYLGASSPGLAPACSTAVQVYPSVPSKLGFTTQPSATATAGVAIPTQPQVSIMNYTNQVITTATNEVTISAFSDGACTTPITSGFSVTTNPVLPASGVVSFAGAKYNFVGTIYLKATASGLSPACSTGITVSPAPQSSLAFYGTVPTSVGAGVNFGLQVRIYDAFGNVAPVSDTIQLTAYNSSNCSGGVLGGFTSTPTAAVLGTATLTNINETVTGVMSIKATDTTTGGVTDACSGPVTVVGGNATTLVFTTQPAATGLPYMNLLTSPVVTIRDSYGNTATGATNTVTLAPFTDASCITPASGTLSADSNPVNPSSGIANFAGVYYSTSGTIYLKATATGLTAACSTAINIGGGASQLAVGGSHACALNNGNVYCWGFNNSGQLGVGYVSGSIRIPQQVVGVGGAGVLSGIVAISASGGGYQNASRFYGGHTCALSSSGAVFCWGANDFGQLGRGSTVASTSPVQVVGVGGVGFLSNVVKISAGGGGCYGHSCAVTSSGAAYCWGTNSYGQIGDNTTTHRASPVQVTGVGGVGFLANVIDIVAAKNSDLAGTYQTFGHSCAILSDGSVFCWGANDTGQLGDNSTTNRTAPVQVRGVGNVGTLGNITQISSARSGSNGGHTCGVSSSGHVFCWGGNQNRQLGDGSTTQRLTPVQVVGVGAVGVLANITKITTGSYGAGSGTQYNYTCAAASSGTAYCWGSSDYALGSGTNISSSPVTVNGVGGVGTLSNVLTISASSTNSSSYNNTCASDSSGNVYCWGSRYTGVIADGDSASNGWGSINPVKIWAPNTVIYSDFAVSRSHGCGVVAGNVYCMGRNSNGQLGDGTTTARYTPVKVLGVGGVGFLSDVISISASSEEWGGTYYGRTCAVTASGAAYCWGYGGYGQLGNGGTANSSTPVLVSGGHSFSKIMTTGGMTGSVCGILTNGNTRCWGYSNSSIAARGIFGASESSTTTYSSPVQGPFTSNVVELSLSSASNEYTWMQYGYGASYYGFGCAITGSVPRCWGYGADGQLGDNSGSSSGTPTGVSTSFTDFTKIVTSLGRYMSSYYGTACGLRSNGQVQCWGYGSNGQIGEGASTNRIAATTVSGITNATSIAAMTDSYYGYPTFCASLASGGISCWGYGGNWATGRASDGVNSTNQLTPVTTSLGAGLTFTKLVGGESLCGQTTTGLVLCWGPLDSYVAPDMSANFFRSLTLPVPSGLTISGIAAGANHSCAAANGYGYCWGNGSGGALGNGGTANVLTTSSVLSGAAPLLGVSKITAGSTGACTVSSSSTVSCWGDGMYGALGNATTTTSLTATSVVGTSGTGSLGNVSEASSGSRHTCTVVGGSVYCWGWNVSGQLGTNSTISSATPVQVVGVGASGWLTGVTKVASGYAHTCALKGGEVYCWGNNSYGQLGIDSTTNSKTPVRVLNVAGGGSLNGVTAIAAGAYHTCAVAGGQVYCWGSNSSGQLGDSSSSNALYPTGVLNTGYVGLTGASSLSAGASHTCAVMSAGTVYCWGAGGYGQLGTGLGADSSVAVQVVGVGGAGNLTGISTISTGSTGYHNCALNSGGSTVYCWGAGASGQLGNNTTPAQQYTPVAAIVAVVGVNFFTAR